VTLAKHGQRQKTGEKQRIEKRNGHLRTDVRVGQVFANRRPGDQTIAAQQPGNDTRARPAVQAPATGRRARQEDRGVARQAPPGAPARRQRVRGDAVRGRRRVAAAPAGALDRVLLVGAVPPAAVLRRRRTEHSRRERRPHRPAGHRVRRGHDEIVRRTAAPARRGHHRRVSGVRAVEGGTTARAAARGASVQRVPQVPVRHVPEAVQVSGHARVRRAGRAVAVRRGVRRDDHGVRAVRPEDGQMSGRGRRQGPGRSSRGGQRRQ